MGVICVCTSQSIRDKFSSITFSRLWGFCEAVLLYTLKIAEKTLAEICREVVHVQVGLEEEREADRIDALQQEMKVFL